MKRSAEQVNVGAHRRRLTILTLLAALLAIQGLAVVAGLGTPAALAQQGDLQEIGPDGDSVEAVLIPLEGPLDSRAARLIERALDRADALDAGRVILEIDVRDGQVSAAEDIARRLRRLDRPVTAYVRGDAHSAGAWVALAADEIVLHRAATFGDASAASFSDSLTQNEQARLTNRLRAEFRLLAELHDRPAALAEAMVDPALAVWRVRDVRSGDIRLVLDSDLAGQVRGAPGQEDPQQAQWEYQASIVEQGRTLLLTPREALNLGLADAVVANRAQLLARHELSAEPLVLDHATVARTAAERDAPIDRTAPTEGDEPADADDPAQPVQPAPDREFQNAFVIPIRDGRVIDVSLADSIRRKILMARAQGADVIVFELDTPGGRVDAALRISGMIKRDLDDIHTVAFIHPEAISAGALLALACDEIVMAPGGKLGDAAPIVMGGTIEGVEREKIETYLRSEFRSSAEANGYPTALAEAMVSADLEVWLVEHIGTGERQYVRRDEWTGRVQVPAGISTAPTRGDADWELVRVIVPAGQLLTMTTSEAVEHGFVAEVIDDWDGLVARYNLPAEPTFLEDTWSEVLVMFLTSSAVSAILLMLMLFFIYTEVNTPGLGLPGLLAVVCAALLFGSRYLAGMAQWWEIGIFVVGVVLLLAEIFVTPGFGVLGVLGLLLMVAGLLAILVANPPGELPLPRGDLVLQEFLQGLFAFGLAFIGAIVLAMIAARYLPKVESANWLVLAPVRRPLVEPGEYIPPIRQVKVGDTGVVETLCRPAGQARFDGNLIDVTAEGEYIPPGAQVVVTRHEGNRLRVRRFASA